MKKQLSNRILLSLVAISLSALFMGFSGRQLKPKPDKQKRFDYLVREDMFQGFNGDSALLQKALRLCADTLRANPNHAEALVWHGTAIWFLSGQAFQKRDYEHGMALYDSAMTEMDRAVELDPDDIAVRIPRGAAILAAAPYTPEPNRTILLKKGLVDYERTFTLQKRYFSTLPLHSRGELLGGIADTYRRLGEDQKARKYFTLITKDLKGSEYAKRASDWLKQKDMAESNTLKPATCIGCHSEN